MSQPDVLLDPSNPKKAIKAGTFPKFQVRAGLTGLLLGFLILLIGLRPDLFGWDRGQNIGFVQIIVILLGIGLMTLSATGVLIAFWNGGPKSLRADFGTRIIATGYVICAFTALADAFGFGTNPLPYVLLGTLQSRGVIIGILVICVGLLFVIRPKKYLSKEQSLGKRGKS
ncbi:MAG TPA: hypothetical protein PKY64_03705 [Anaerolineaceae bacterium]|nr:hypothetical protein [Anaerolineaceae bacterium]